MKLSKKNHLWLGTLCLLILSLTACQSTNEDGKSYYAIESEGMIYGYVESTIQNIEIDGKPMVVEKAEIRSISSALGMNIDTTVEAEYHVDPKTGHWPEVKKATPLEDRTIYPGEGMALI